MEKKCEDCKHFISMGRVNESEYYVTCEISKRNGVTPLFRPNREICGYFEIKKEGA